MSEPKAAEVLCVWDTEGRCYVPVSSHRGVALRAAESHPDAVAKAIEQTRNACADKADEIARGFRVYRDHFQQAEGAETVARAIRNLTISDVLLIEEAAAKLVDGVDFRAIAHKVLGSDCACYADAWPQESCDSAAIEAARMIKEELLAAIRARAKMGQS